MNKQIHGIFSITTIACFLAALGVLSRELYIPLLPQMTASLPGNHFFSTSMIAATLFGMGVSQFFYGPISDAIGRRHTLIFGLTMLALASFLSALVKSSFSLWLMQIFCGMGAGACVVISRAILRDKLTGNDLTKAIAYQSMAATIPPFLGPLTGALLLDCFGWRSGFIFSMIISLLMITIIFLHLKETNQNIQRSLLNIKEIVKSYFLILHNPYFMSNVLLISFSFLPLVIYSTMSPFVFQNELHVSAKCNAIYYGITTLGYFLGSLITNRLCYKIHTNLLIKISLFLSFFGALLLFMLVLMATQNSPSITIFVFFIFIGCGILTPVMSKQCIEPFPHLAGISAALVYSFHMVLPALVIALLMAIGYKNLLAMSFYIMITTTMTVLLFFWFMKKLPEFKGQH